METVFSPAQALQQRLQEQRARIAANLADVKKTIAVLSGKGGVGKTFVSVHLAKTLVAKGFKVGLLDADIDCPNLFVFLDIHAQLEASADGKIIPVEKDGLKVVSMAGLNEPGKEEDARIWRGPLIGKAIADLLEKSAWEELDFLLIDMPPGTSDAALTVMQFLKLDGCIVVGTSSPAAVLDAKKAVLMCKEMQQPVLGLVENMSGTVFGSGKIRELATEMEQSFLGEVPLADEKTLALGHFQQAIEKVAEKVG